MFERDADRDGVTASQLEVGHMQSLRTLVMGLSLVASAIPALAADVSGRWRITITTPDETITGTGVLEQSGTTVTGWVGPDENNPITVKGSVEKNILTLRTFPRPGRTVAFDRCHVTVSGDKMTGKIEREGSGDAGTIEFVRSAKK
jgi:hypothetical protein